MCDLLMNYYCRTSINKISQFCNFYCNLLAATIAAQNFRIKLANSNLCGVIVYCDMTLNDWYKNIDCYYHNIVLIIYL